LSGSAAKLFAQLDPKARTQLEGYVSAGVLKAEDVEKGLRGIAKGAVLKRHENELQPNADEIEEVAAVQDRSNKRGAYYDAIKTINTEFMDRKEALGERPEIISKSLSIEEAKNPDDLDKIKEKYDEMLEHDKEQMQIQLEFQKKSDAIYADFHEKNAKLTKEYTEKNGSIVDKIGIDERKTRSYRAFVNMQKSGVFDEESNRNMFSVDEMEAREKLLKLGFKEEQYGDAAQKYAASVDLSGVRDIPLSEYPEPGTPLVEASALVSSSPKKKANSSNLLLEEARSNATLAPRPSFPSRSMPEQGPRLEVSYDAKGDPVLPSWAAKAQQRQPPSSVLDLAAAPEQKGQLEDVLKMLKDNTRNRV